MRALLFPLVLFLLRPVVGQDLHSTFTRLADNVEVHTSYNMLGDVRFPSNGLIVETRDSVVLIDTGWGRRATREILRQVKEKGKPVAACFVTHSHDDRTGGIPVLRKHGIRCMGTARTRDVAIAHHRHAPETILRDDTLLVIDGMRFVFFYPGPGHASDNMVVWLPEQRVLHGGCFIKSTEATTLGNMAEADVKAWPASVHRLRERFPDAQVVIPGHEAWGGMELLEHTLRLLGAE